ncbi:MAG TPA: diguanylate cyclase [Rhodanobacter sp.]
MNYSSPESLAPSHLVERTSQRDLLPRRIYRFRVLGMGLAALPIGVVLHEHQAPLGSWIWMVFSCLLWPHLAYWRALRSQSKFHSELHNLMFDSAVAGSWAALLHFTVLPAVLLIAVTTADKINTGVSGLWQRSLPGMLLGLLVGGWLTGFAFQPETSMAVILACLPIMLIHTLMVSLASYQLVRRVQRQNRQLDEFSRIDMLTGLNNRRSWEDLAAGLLQRHHETGLAVTLMMIDVDGFKEINDRHGHILGDDVLRKIASILRHGNGVDACLGRFGGDEFAVAVPATLAEASVVAERIRHTVEKLDLPQTPNLNCSISIGLAVADGKVSSLRQWMELADHALYQAKQAGRNRTARAGETVMADA